MGDTQFASPCDEFMRVRGIELEHFKVTRDYHSRPDIFAQLRRFASVQISGHAPLRFRAVDRKEHDIDRELFQYPRHLGISNGIAAVINGPPAKLNNVTEKLA